MVEACVFHEDKDDICWGGRFSYLYTHSKNMNTLLQSCIHSAVGRGHLLNLAVRQTPESHMACRVTLLWQVTIRNKKGGGGVALPGQN